MKRTTRTLLRLALPFAAISLLGAAPAFAQETEEEVEENCICFDGDRPHRTLRAAWVGEERARIGVLLGDPAEVAGRTGIEVVDVTADGPAEGAGLQAGDIITALNGEELGDQPGDALVEAMSAVEPGDAVTLTYYRDGQRQTVDVVTDAMGARALFSAGNGAWNVRVAPHLDELRERVERIRIAESDIPGANILVRRMGHRGLQLVDMNPGLGEYFGTARGVLVVDVDEDVELGLQPGDVILTIDGRDLRDAGHAHDILGSYRSDETVTLRIVRAEREMEVQGSSR